MKTRDLVKPFGKTNFGCRRTTQSFPLRVNLIRPIFLRNVDQDQKSGWLHKSALLMETWKVLARKLEFFGREIRTFRIRSGNGYRLCRTVAVMLRCWQQELSEKCSEESTSCG